MLARNTSLVVEELQSPNTVGSPTPLLRAKPKLGQYSMNTKMDMADASDSESEHSLCDDVGDYDYFYKIRKMMQRLPEQNDPRYKYSLRKLFDSDILSEIPDPEIEDLPSGFSEDETRERAEAILLNDKINVALNAFYKVMNDTATALGLKRSHFAVAHGMHHYDNYSSAMDIAMLTKVTLRTHPLFVEVVNTKAYECASKVTPGHIYKWENTNRLLWDNSGRFGKSAFFGVKTGNTPIAGPCLCVNYRD
jgi:hypothetical protein